MLMFWTYGYAGTSLQDLVEKTKLLRGSIYHSFGDKRSLYIQTLQRYGQTSLQQAMDILNSPGTSYENFRALLMVVVDGSAAERRRGSMLCNSIVEVVPHDPQIAEVVNGILDDFKKVVQSALDRASRMGELGPGTDAKALSRYVVSSIQGLCVTAKAGAPRDELLDIVDMTLSALK